MNDNFMWKAQSETIDALRVPMTILVVCIHFNILAYPLVSHGDVIQYDISWVQYPISLFSEVLGRLAVPFFFLISGYFFFLKDNQFTSAIYLNKLKKRFYSLFVPYVSWWIVACVLTFVFSKAKLVAHLSFYDYLCGIWCSPKSNLFLTTSINTPLDGPLWFLRDLMLTMVLSPFIYLLIKNRKHSAVLLLFLSIVYVIFGGLDLPQYFIPGLSFPCLLFFSIGGYLGFHKINMIELLYPYRTIILPLSFLLIVLDVCLTGYTAPLTWGSSMFQNGYIHHAQILLGVPATLLVGYSLRNKMQWFKQHSASSFTIFALHKIIILPVGYIVVYLLHIGNVISTAIALMLYFGIILLLTIVGIFAHWVISKNTFLRKAFTGDR